MDAVSVSTNAVWSTSFYGRTLLRIDPARRSVTRRIHLPGQGSGVLVRGGSVWVSAYDANVVLELDAASGRTLRRVRVGSEPRDLAWDGRALWSVNQLSDSVSRVAPS
jgi:streptogramin lyase